MANFVGHEPCPECGSRNNLGRYDDGSGWCFGCGHYERATGVPRRYKELTADDDTIPQLPDDTGTAFAPAAVQWLAQYHLSVEQAIAHGVRWSDSRQQLIFLLEDGCWQARNFNTVTASKRKYFTAGDVNDSIKLYRVSRQPLAERRSHEGVNQEPTEQGAKEVEESSVLALVEDCVSAIRVSEQCDAMPILGSHVSVKKLARLSRFYDKLIFWLDPDKLTEARTMAGRVQMLGLEVAVIYTKLDPKCYTFGEIKEILDES